MNHLKKLFWFSLIVKMILVAALPLTSDESYYWVWSRHMQLSYYDHPPFVAWLFWLGDFTRWFPGSVRWPGVLFGHLGLWLWLRALTPFLTVEQRVQWLWLALLSPLVGGTGLLVTPDLPLLVFYGLALWLFFLWQAAPSMGLSLVFGLALGLGFTSKYMMVLFVLSLLPLLAFSKTVRYGALKSAHWIALGGVLGATPVWLWNYMNDFASIKFQAAHGLGRVWKPSWTIHYVGAQIGIIFPIVLYWALQARRKLPLAFHLLAWVPLGFFFFTTFRGYVEANWPIVAYPVIFALAVASFPRNVRGLQITQAVWGVALVTMAALVLAQPSWSKNIKLKEFHQFDAIVERARGLEPMFARSYQMASKMHFELRVPVYKLKGMNRRDYYDSLRFSEPAPGTIYYLAAEKTDALPPAYRGDQVLEKIPVDERYEIWKVQRP